MRTRSVITLFLATGLMLLHFNANSQIVSGNCFIQGQYVELGIGPCGTFGTSINAPAGYHPRGGSSGNPLRLGFVADHNKDGWTAGSPTYCGDYYVPGTPEEGWGISINGVNYNNSLLCNLSNVPGSIIEYRNDGAIISGMWEGAIAGLSIKSKTLVPVDKLYFLTEVTLENTTTDTLRNIYYMRNIDPDNEQTLSGNYTTRNTVLFQNPNPDNKAVVTAEGLLFGCYIALGTRDCRAKVSIGGFSNRNAANAWNCVAPHSCAGTQTADIAITISFKVGDLAPGRQTSLKFVNVLNIADLDEAVDLTGPSFEIGGTEVVNSGDTARICSSGPTTFEVVNTGGFDNWTWSPATGLNTTSGPIVTCDGGIDTLTYTATGVNTCGGSISIKFTAIKGNITHVPKAGAISGTTNFCLPATTSSFTVPPIPNATDYVWRIPPGASILSGDGTNSITVNLGSAILYDSISVHGVNVCGAGDTSTLRISVCDCSNVYTVAPPVSSICPGDSIRLTTPVVAGAEYIWYRNGSLIPAVNSNSFWARDSGNYYVVIRPTPFCSNNSTVARVNLTNPPDVTLTPSGKIYKCEGSPTPITANVVPNAPGAFTIDWYKNGVLLTANGPATINVTDDGVYSVRVTNSSSCKTTSVNDTVISRKRPVVESYTFLGSSVTCDAGSNVLKSVNSSIDGAITAYQWYLDGVAIPGGTTPEITVNLSGNYRLELTTEYGCKNITRDTALVYNPKPIAVFDPPNGCLVGSYTFNDASTIPVGSITGWTWKKDGVVFSTSKNPVTNFDPGSYSIELTVQSDKGCISDPFTLPFLRYGKPSANFVIDGTCADSLTKLTPVVSDPGYGNTGITNWSWELGNGEVSSVSNPSLVYDDAGFYTIRLTYHGNNCTVITDSISKRVYLGDALPAMKYHNVVTVENEPFVLFGGADGVKYEWQPATGLTNPFGKTTTGKLSTSQLYEVHVTNQYGCERVDTVQVVVINDCRVIMPNAFTPNRDGRNEILRGYFGCLKTLYHFSIFNRWGQRIFTTKNSTQGWDGRYNGQDQGTGTFVWIAEGEFLDGKRFTEKGTVTLIR